MNIGQLHRKAMELMQRGIVAKEIGNTSEGEELHKKAFEFEKEAAVQLHLDYDNEPKRSVLFLSAASLAVDCGLFREAEKLVNMALSGNPPESTADDLRDLYETINFDRHMKLNDVDLSSSEIQMSLTGKEVGLGIVNSKEFIGRYRKFEILTRRTAERKLGRPFNKSVNKVEGFRTFLSTPRAASFAVTIRIATSGVQLDIFKETATNRIQEVIDEILLGIEMLNDGRDEELRKSISDESYFQNFVSLTKAIAPDGDRVRQVGFSVKRNGKDISVGFVRSKKSIHGLLNGGKKEAENIIVEGYFKVADAINNKIAIVNNETKDKINLKVPDGLDDIVKEYWDSMVIATIQKKGKTNKLIDIEPYEGR